MIEEGLRDLLATEAEEEMTREQESLSEKASASSVARRATSRETVLKCMAAQEADHLQEETEMTDTRKTTEEEANLQVLPEVREETTRAEVDQAQRDLTEEALTIQLVIIKNIKKLIPDKNLNLKCIPSIVCQDDI
jgi:hypothetical protein